MPGSSLPDRASNTDPLGPLRLLYPGLKMNGWGPRPQGWCGVPSRQYRTGNETVRFNTEHPHACVRLSAKFTHH